MVFTAVLTALVFLPILPVIFIPLALRCLGLYLQSSTRQRRETILVEVRREDTASAARNQTPQTREDDDWERIDGYQTPSAPNGGIPQDPEWDGIVGFFHPFW
jgi:hypothetical protein